MTPTRHPSRKENGRTTANTTTRTAAGRTLVLGGTGKTGRRVAERLGARGVPIRIGSRSAETPFEWNDPATWPPVLEGAASVYIAYYPDLAVPGAADTIQAFTDRAVASGVGHLVLLAGRGEEEADRCEAIVRASGTAWTILRPTWFSQNFSEGFLRDAVLGGTVALPVGEVLEPFVDVEDIADVAAAALTDPGRHAGQTYELTGPRLMRFSEAIDEIARATGTRIAFVPIPHEAFVRGLKEEGMPEDVVWLLSYLFSVVMDGRNSRLAGGVERALGRPARDFRSYAETAAAAGAWDRAA
jgi:uncharacterized protein YbjT (DUF2867 family)